MSEGIQKQSIKSAGLKVTAPRVFILELLDEDHGRHLSAEDIYQILQERNFDLSLATVYRVLTQFESAGLVQKHRFEDDKNVYEIASSEHHDHLVCVKCGSIAEFIDPVIEDRQTQIAKEHNFHITDHKLSIYGLCGACRT